MREMRNTCLYCGTDEKEDFLFLYQRSEKERDREAHTRFDRWRNGSTSWNGVPIDLEEGWKQWQGPLRTHLCLICAGRHVEWGWQPVPLKEEPK